MPNKLHNSLPLLALWQQRWSYEGWTRHEWGNLHQWRPVNAAQQSAHRAHLSGRWLRDEELAIYASAASRTSRQSQFSSSVLITYFVVPLTTIQTEFKNLIDFACSFNHIWWTSRPVIYQTRAYLTSMSLSFTNTRCYACRIHFCDECQIWCKSLKK